MSERYVTFYTKEKGKQEFTEDEWYRYRLDVSKLTFHREDGPALEYASGHKDYYINGKRHRENGPAREWKYGRKDYYINDNELKKRSLPPNK